MAKETIKIQLKMKQLDDVFHRLIISLERLEAFLEFERLQGETESHIVTTAIGTSRDLHNDKNVVPSRETFLGEVQLQLTALYYQIKFDDADLFNGTMRYFLKDLLQWYGGRGCDIPYNEVDTFVLPIIVALSRQVKSVVEIMKVVEKYVAAIKSISDYNEEQRYHAVMTGWAAYQTALEENAQETKVFLDSGKDVTMTSHVRSTELEGFKRLYLAMTSMFDESLPAKVLCRTVTTYLPEVMVLVPDATEENIDKIIEARRNLQSGCRETIKESKEEETKISESQTTSPVTSQDRLHDFQKPLEVANNQEGNASEQVKIHDEYPVKEDAEALTPVNDKENDVIVDTLIAYETNADAISVGERDFSDKDCFNAEYMPDDKKDEPLLNESEESNTLATVDSSSSFIEDCEFECSVDSIEVSGQDNEHNEEESFFTRLTNKDSLSKDE